MDSLFILNDAGSFLLEKHYRARLSREACQPLLYQLQQHGPKSQKLAPWIVRSNNGYTLMHIHREKVLLVAAVSCEIEPQLIFDMLHGIYLLLCQYCCGGLPLSEESLRTNYSSVYVMLDLAADFGYPFIMEGNVMQMLLNPSSMIAKAIQLVQGSSRVLTSLAASIGLRQQTQQAALASQSDVLPGAGMGTGSGHGEGSGLSGSGSDHWWRRGGVTYASNEVYVDIIEEIGGIIDKWVHPNNKLSGLPELSLSVRNPATLKDAAFHPCVRISRFKKDGVLAFCPPDREFCLANYWLPERNLVLPVSVSGFVSFPQSSEKNHEGISSTVGGSAASEASSGRLSLRLSAHNPLGIASSGSGGSCGAAENIVVHIPLPSFVASATLTATSGTIRHITSKQMISWEVPYLAFDSPQVTAEGTVTLVPDEAQRKDVIAPHESCLAAQVSFLVKNWVPSGIKLDSLDVACINAQPYKGCRYGTIGVAWHMNFITLLARCEVVRTHFLPMPEKFH